MDTAAITVNRISFVELYRNKIKLGLKIYPNISTTQYAQFSLKMEAVCSTYTLITRLPD
jgi:hypothetical protein